MQQIDINVTKKPESTGLWVALFVILYPTFLVKHLLGNVLKDLN